MEETERNRLEWHKEELNKAKYLHEIKNHLIGLKQMATPEAIEALVEYGIVHNEESDKQKERFSKTAEALIEIGKPVIGATIRIAMKNAPNAQTLKNAIYVLGKVGGGKAAKAIMDYGLPHTQATVVEFSANMLSTLKDPRAIEPLTKHGLTHNDTQAAIMSTIALGSIGTKKAAEAIITKGFPRPDMSVQRGSVSALLSEPMKKETVLPLVRKHLKDENDMVKANCAFLLGRLGDKSDLLSLMKLGGHENKAVSKNVKEAIRKIQRREKRG